MAKGAIDFYFTAIQMKKGRPALQLSVLTAHDSLQVIGDYILEHTTSIGLRYYAVDRQVLPRRNFELETPYGKVEVKEVISPSGRKRHKIAYDSLRKLAELNDINILHLQKEIYPLLTNLSAHEKEK